MNRWPTMSWWKAIEDHVAERERDAPDPWGDRTLGDAGLTDGQEDFLAGLDDQPRPVRLSDAGSHAAGDARAAPLKPGIHPATTWTRLAYRRTREGRWTMTARLGVDLGTTWTAAALSDGQHVEPVKLGASGASMPSVVAIADGKPVAGDAAVRVGRDQPTAVAREFKRRLGDSTPIVLGGTPYGPEALTGHLLAHVVTAAERGQRRSARSR